MDLTIANMADNPSEHSPSEWEKLALKLEKDRFWDSAMRAWRKAMSASAGHNRRDHYEARAKELELKHGR